MRQSRAVTGVKFEKDICESKGWKHKSASPRINWSGKGRSNWKKMKQVDLDPTKFIPNPEKSRLEKYDAINKDGEKIEIKKYQSEDLKGWHNYSEPIFKIATRSVMKTVINIFGGGDYDKSVVEYNKFIDGVIDNIGDEIIRGITSSNIGVQCVDRFIPQSELEYKWEVKKGWKGYNRLTIVFRIKN